MVNTKEYRGISGIYAITHIDSGKLYIGSAINIISRWKDHRKLLRRGTHHSIHLQNAWNKYGENLFSFSILEIVKEFEDLIVIEQQWMNIYESYHQERGYNINPIAGSMLGTKQSPEHIEKLAALRRGKKHSEEWNKKISESLKGIKRSPESVEKSAWGRSKKWIVISPEGERLEIQNLHRFCRLQSLSCGAMQSVAKGKRNNHKGWRCEHY